MEPDAESAVTLVEPGTLKRRSVTVPAVGSLLVGRRPDASKIALRGAPAVARMVTLDSPRVSENHLLLWREGDRVVARDLGSRNGTREVLGRDTDHVTGGHSPTLELAFAPAASTLGPAAAEWSSEKDFREAVVLESRRWIEPRGLGSTVRLAPSGTVTAPSPLHIPLGDDWFLEVQRLGEAQGGTESPQLTAAIDQLWRYVNQMRGRFEVEQDSEHDEMVFASASLRRVHQRVCEVARLGLNAILLGESGVGKTALARCFHTHSERRHKGEFVSTNLGEDSSDVKFFQRKMFGARRGASVNIDRDEIGLAQRADGGVLFLDEVGELPIETQAVLLQFLDSGRFRRLGDSGAEADRRSNVRVIAGTNRDLRAAVRARSFREDLWHRLAGDVIEIPPLRDRREDISAFLQRTMVPHQHAQRRVFDLLTDDAREFLVHRYDWPGNFRAMVHFTRRIPIFLEGPLLDRRRCEEILAATAIDPPTASKPSPAAVMPGVQASWSDLLPTALALLPAWLKARSPRPSDNFALRRDGQLVGLEYRILLDEIVKPMCMARALGVEDWTELPRRPDPSYQAMAERLGFGDGKSIQDVLRLYVDLRRMTSGLGPG